MDKKTRFKPASFWRSMTFTAGTRLYWSAPDGIAARDALDVEAVTPIVIHPIFKPVEIGPLIEFARRNDLLEALRLLTQHINGTQAERAQR